MGITVFRLITTCIMEYSKSLGNLNFFSLWIGFVLCLGLVVDRYWMLPLHMVTFGAAIFIAARHRKDFISDMRVADVAVLLVLIAWVYGLVYGLLNGNDPWLVFHNFFGMSYYFYYFVLLWAGIKQPMILLWLILGCLLAIIECAYSIFLHYERVVGLPDYLTYGRFLRFYYNEKIAIALALFGFCLFTSHTFRSSERLSSKLPLALAMQLVIILILLLLYHSASKGYVIALSFVLGAAGIYAIRHGKVGMFVAVLLYSFAFFYLADGYIILQECFGIHDKGNLVRYEQMKLMSRELRLFGTGLGGAISSSTNYVRDPIKIYASELSYLNLIQKLGFVSSLVFFSYFYSLAIMLKNLCSLDDKYFMNAAFVGMLSFLFPAIGNPNLFSFVFVILHVFFIFSFRSHSSRLAPLFYTLKTLLSGIIGK